MKLVSYISPNFWPGLKVLAHSLAHKGNISGVPWIVMTDEPAPKEWGDWLGFCGFDMIDVRFSQVGTLPAELPGTADHLKFNFNKLRMFLLPDGEYIYLDVDFLCLRDAGALLTTPSLTAANERPGISNGMINAGLIRFDGGPAGEWMFSKCMHAIDMTVLAGLRLGLAEQTIINTVIMRNRKAPEARVHLLGDEWNMPAFLATRNPKLWRPDRAIFVHYTGQSKPWMGIERRAREERDRNPPQKKAIDIWRDYAETELSR